MVVTQNYVRVNYLLITIKNERNSGQTVSSLDTKYSFSDKVLYNSFSKDPETEDQYVCSNIVMVRYIFEKIAEKTVRMIKIKVNLERHLKAQKG
jgi:hypothetical protein